MAEKTKIQYINFYSAGSVARKYDLTKPVYEQPDYPEPAAQPQRKRRIVVRVDPLAVCSIVVSAVMLVLMVTGVFQLHNAWQQEQALAAYVEQLYAQNQELEETYRSGYDLEEIERKALALGLVPVDQVQHIRMQVELPAQKVEEPSFWEEMTAFFAGIFA
jgi:hypothetical protein